MTCRRCDGATDIAYDWERVRGTVTAAIDRRGAALALALRGAAARAVPSWSSAPGGPRSYARDRLSELLGIDLHLKLEGANPTRSYKDRIASVAVAAALDHGVTTLCCSSTGNLGDAVAAAAAATGLEAIVLAPAGGGAADGRARHPGARVFAVDGTYDDCRRLELELGALFPWGFVSGNLHPYASEGAKTISFEIAEQLDWQLPDAVVCPAASGTLFSKLAQGFAELTRAGLSRGPVPRLYRRRRRRARARSPTRSPTIAASRASHAATDVPSLAVGDPSHGDLAIGAARASGGGIVRRQPRTRSRRTPRCSARRPASTPTARAAAALGALAEAIRRGEIERGSRVVLVVTGARPSDADERDGNAHRGARARRAAHPRGPRPGLVTASMAAARRSRRHSSPRSGATSACSETILGTRARRAGGRVAARARRAIRGATRAARRAGPARASTQRSPRVAPDAAGARAARVRRLLPAREHRRAAPPPAAPARGRARRPRPARIARRRLRRARRPAGRRARRARTRNVGPARPHRASDGGDAAHACCSRTSGSSRAARRASTIRASRPRSGAQAEERHRRGGDAALADRRGAARPPARSRTRSATALWFFEHSLIAAATELLRVWRERLPGAPPPLAFGTLDRRRHGRQPGGRAGLDRRGARARPRARARPLPRRGARARGRARGCTARSSRSPPSSRSRSRATSASCPAYAAEIGAPERARAVPAQALVHVVAARATTATATRSELLDDSRVIAESLRGERRRAASPTAASRGSQRMVETVRVPRREARRPPARARARERRAREAVARGRRRRAAGTARRRSTR